MHRLLNAASLGEDTRQAGLWTHSPQKPAIFIPGDPAFFFQSFAFHNALLPPCDGPDNPKDLCPGRHGVGQQRIHPFVGQVFLASEEPEQWSALMGDVVADGAAQHRIAGFERVEDRALRDGGRDVERHLALDLGEVSQVEWQFDSDHDSVWTSTENTAGRSRTMGNQRSPPSAEAYTCPPVVPK